MPNALTVSRLLLAFAFPFLPESARVPVVAYGLASEFLDGWLARRLGSVSRVGVLLDPIADKAFVFAVLGTLLLDGATTVGDLLLVGARDVVVAALSLLLLFRRDLLPHARARRLGKATTALQFGFLLWLVFFGTAPRALVWGTFALGAAALVDYARAWSAVLSAPDD